jgi:hypothetical protein
MMANRFRGGLAGPFGNHGRSSIVVLVLGILTLVVAAGTVVVISFTTAMTTSLLFVCPLLFLHSFARPPT